MRTPLSPLFITAGLVGMTALAAATGLAAGPATGIVRFDPAPTIEGSENDGSYDIDVIHPAADSFEAFRGRAVLVEFFAHW